MTLVEIAVYVYMAALATGGIYFIYCLFSGKLDRTLNKVFGRNNDGK